MSILTTLAACQAFIESQPPAVIAAQLRQDQRIAQENRGFPSLLVYCLPPPSSSASKRIAQALSSDDDDLESQQAHVPLVVSKMRLAGIVQGIKAYLAEMKRHDGAVSSGLYKDGPLPPQLIPSDDDFNAALKVLRYMQLPFQSLNLNNSTPLLDVIATIEGQLLVGPDIRASQLQDTSGSSQTREQRNALNRKRKCYICLFLLTTSHPLYPALCVPCGNFNTASSSLSLPPQFDLKSKFALVTGARINLGYHTTLRLLRGGCSVIASTRYPYDAEIRYMAEPDAMAWKDRLRIVGADFRAAKDVFALVGIVKDCLRDWHQEKLDVLINNAAQTLTDHADVEVKNGEREENLKSESASGLVVDRGYIPRLRGGMATIEASPTHITVDYSKQDTSELLQGQTQGAIFKPVKSSWIQKLDEIPYEDVISAHSINSFVPLILMRELRPIMIPKPFAPGEQSHPVGYIINVSSREGIPETRPSHPAKAGHHVHTNMSKAALNMLTETEAGSAWWNHRIAINSVDPGYMSADPEWMEMLNIGREICPIGWEDGAARVLWPIVMGEKGTPVWGRFLKHFQVFDVTR